MVTQVSTGYPNPHLKQPAGNEEPRTMSVRPSRPHDRRRCANSRAGFPTGHSRAVRIDQSPFPALLRRP